MDSCCHSLIFQWQVQRDAGLCFRAVLEVAKEANQRVESNDQAHAQIQHRGAADEVIGGLHVVLQGHDYTDALQRKDDSAEEQWPLSGRHHAHTLSRRWQIREHVHKRDDNADKHQNVGDHREGCQELQIAHEAHEN